MDDTTSLSAPRTHGSKFGFEFPRFSTANICLWCGAAFDPDMPALAKTREHIMPAGTAGKNGGPNVGASHAWCNRIRDRDIRWRPFDHPASEMPAGQLVWLGVMRQTMAQLTAHKKRLGKGLTCRYKL